MPIGRRDLLRTLGIGAAIGVAGCNRGETPPSAPVPTTAPPLVSPSGNVNWRAVRELFPLSPDWVHLASFLFVSHPRPVAEAIEQFRRRIDADPLWIEDAAFSDAEGRPFAAIKTALADYVGGKPEEICLTSNTTSALAMAYHGLRLRAGQEIVTTEHDHFSQHESIRYAAERSGARVRYVALYDAPSHATAGEMTARIAAAIGPKTRAIGVTWVHSSTGVKVPIAAIADVVSRANRGRAAADRCLLIVDGVHGFGNQDVDIARLGCDFFASGTHKWFFAPRGTGFLWGRADVWPELRPTIPSFDPDGLQTWDAWMQRAALPPTQAAFVSPGGFLAYEYFLAVPAAAALHRTIGRARIADRIAGLSQAFRDGASQLPNVTLHTPRDPAVSAGLSCYEVAGVSAADVARRLAARRLRTNSSPYKASYARVATGIMNTEADVEAVLREIRSLA